MSKRKTYICQVLQPDSSGRFFARQNGLPLPEAKRLDHIEVSPPELGESEALWRDRVKKEILDEVAARGLVARNKPQLIADADYQLVVYVSAAPQQKERKRPVFREGVHGGPVTRR